MLSMRCACLAGIRINQSAAVKGRKKPFMGVDNKAVCSFYAVKKCPGRWRSQRRTAISAIDMKPDALFVADIANTLHIVDDAKVGGARRAGHRE